KSWIPFSHPWIPLDVIKFLLNEFSVKHSFIKRIFKHMMSLPFFLLEGLTAFDNLVSMISLFISCNRSTISYTIKGLQFPG
ncbi:MAG: hypothetical protein ABJA71_09910, partial [Ginsengibacter sp.]